LDQDSEERVTSPRKRRSEKSKGSPKKTAALQTHQDHYELDLKEGQEVVGVVVQAPKDGLGMSTDLFSRTLQFLTSMTSTRWPDITKHPRFSQIFAGSKM
jgi:hypothetical protein